MRLVLLLVLGVLGCNAAPTACTASIEPGIVVAVRDATTQQPVARGAVAQLSSGSYSETLLEHGFSNGQLTSLAGAFERPGTYQLKVNQQGYAPWSEDNIVVSKDTCHVITVKLEASLSPLP